MKKVVLLVGSLFLFFGLVGCDSQNMSLRKEYSEKTGLSNINTSNELLKELAIEANWWDLKLNEDSYTNNSANTIIKIIVNNYDYADYSDDGSFCVAGVTQKGEIGSYNIAVLDTGYKDFVCNKEAKVLYGVYGNGGDESGVTLIFVLYAE
ncbi:hypothetical protein [Culicoidibacter larvae]|uniref:Uncharacterized protein n=1 Tax=Culicoidibacter larvae TaxID=2579976 RepID=A0A5R8Q8U3_9FIRM|nr:hypothetical protein [Culicoidibacter larvae]TLG72035.1 hypothetical protein FEZ08_09385 [Culicoidibacter larvae]